MEAPKITTCHGITAKGIRCQKTVKGAQFCFHHKAQANSPAANAPELSDMDVEFDGNDEDTETGREADLDAQKAELRRQIEELSSYPPSMAETDIVEPLQVARPTTQTQEVRIRSKARTRGREQQQRESLPLQEATLATHNLATAYQPARADTIASSKASSTTSSKAQEWLTRTDPAAEALIKDLDRQTASINPNPTPTPTPDHLKLSTENTHLRTTLAAAHRRLTAESKAAAKMRDEARSASDELQTANAKCARAIDELEKTRSRNDELKKSMTDLKRRETKSDKFSIPPSASPPRPTDAILSEILAVHNFTLNLTYATLYRRILALEIQAEEVGVKIAALMGGGKVGGVGKGKGDGGGMLGKGDGGESAAKIKIKSRNGNVVV